VTRAPVPTSRARSRQQNQAAVFNVVHRRGQVSRSEIAGELRLSPAAVTDITATLIHLGLVYEARSGESATVGRKPILLEVNYDHRFVVGVKASNLGLTTALTNLKAEVVAWRQDPLPNTDPETVVASIGEATERLLRDAGLAPEQLAGIGLGLPGIVEVGTGRNRYSALFGWRDVPLATLLEERLGLPAFVDNDVNALAAAEAWFGAGEDHDSFLVVTVGRGVGLGIVIGGHVYRGPFGGAGELGHVIVDPGGRTCTCGPTGCLEAQIGDAALLEQAREQLSGFSADDTVGALLERAEGGDPAALAIYAEAGTTLGRGLAMLVNVLAPTLIVLGGEGMRAAPFLLPAARDALRDRAFGDLGTRVAFVTHTWDDDAWARGAAGLAASRFLTEVATTVGGD
jgi:predicted NBD/HSP70 family sugar kinase